LETDKETFKKMFPNLAKELEVGDQRVKIDAVRTDSDEAEKTVPDKFRGYCPTVIDFIRRCDTDEQADEIITYLQKRGEITTEYADALRVQLQNKGVRSFGPKKEENYYFKHAGFC
jgi:hypothetical protein